MRPAAIHPAVRRSKAQLLQAPQQKAIFRVNPQQDPGLIPQAEPWSGVLLLQVPRLLSPRSPIPLSIAASNKARLKNRVNSRRISSSFFLKPPPAAGAFFLDSIESPSVPSSRFLETRVPQGVDLAPRLLDEVQIHTSGLQRSDGSPFGFSPLPTSSSQGSSCGFLAVRDCDFGFSRLVDRLERQGTPSRL
jgi:hypothetical protein